MNICLIPNGYRQSPIHSPPRSSDLRALDFCLLGWMQKEFYEGKLDTPDELLARVSDAADSRLKKREDHLRRKTLELRTRFVECFEVDDGTFEHLL